MPRVRSIARTLMLGTALLVCACSDLPTEPQVEVTPTAGLLGDLVGVVGGTVGGVVKVLNGILSPVLTRETPLSQDEVVTEWIGRNGGVIRLPRAGLTVSVPAGALSRPTRITVRAPAGDLLGYEFAPHGLQFNRPVTLTQDVSGRADVEVVYFDGPLQPTVEVLEVLPVWATRNVAVFRIEHFSGYAFRQRGYVIATN